MERIKKEKEAEEDRKRLEHLRSLVTEIHEVTNNNDNNNNLY